MSNLRQLRALIARAAISSVRDPAAYALRSDILGLSEQITHNSFVVSKSQAFPVERVLLNREHLSGTFESD